jgi:hypothetical protein
MVAAVVFALLQLMSQSPLGHGVGALGDPAPTSQLLVSPPTTPSPTETSPAARSATLAEDFSVLEQSLQSTIGIALQPVASTDEPLRLGSWRQGPSWSTIKVPLAIAAVREAGPSTVSDDARAAITQSDNAAAEALWASLGNPATAAQKVQTVLAEAGPPPIVESQQIRPGFSAFGQTVWSLTDQTRFAAFLACNPGDDPVLELMGDIASDQQWGLGALPDSRFKGGWGPDNAGEYLVRQFGIVTTPTGMLAVALAAQPISGSFQEGTQDLTQMANWLDQHLGELPAGHCR